ncbi:hypothetical protein ACM0BL_24385, partial [Mycobacteroides abscessus subsp. abscessus]
TVSKSLGRAKVGIQEEIPESRRSDGAQVTSQNREFDSSSPNLIRFPSRSEERKSEFRKKFQNLGDRMVRR